MMMEDNRPVMVTIRCAVYNHESFIRQCLDGFIMQQTNFRFEAIVHDDASTDGSANIIREYAAKYPEIIKPIYQTENQYSKRDGTIGRILNQHTRGKYVAICEGDDYWTDPLKLQKQVDFLESHPNYVLCTHYFRDYSEDDKKFVGIGPISQIGDKSFDLEYYTAREAWITHPLSAVYLYSAFDLELYSKCKYSKDLTLFFFLLKNGKGFLMKDVMAVYRKHAHGVWNGASRQKRICDDLNCINDICKIDNSKYATKLLKNYLKRTGYLGFSFFKCYSNAYLMSLRLLFKQAGMKEILTALYHNLRYQK